uniref:GATA-type domain-containing protein n=1 Tax=Chenopodium quinoa TaxID=63459 RepID=A0A803LQ03_CHEQI
MLGYANHYHLLSHTPPSFVSTDPTYTCDDSNCGGDDDDDVIIDPLTPSPETGPSKKKSKKSGPLTRKRCTHSGAQETPQWRLGPKGPLTLCNACGLSYLRMGHLLPEYRPVRSPTFSTQIHSNFYRNREVKEMRKKMSEIMGRPDSETLPHPISSFDDLAVANSGSSSCILDHPVSSSEKYEISPLTASERTVMQLPSSGGSSNDAEAMVTLLERHKYNLDGIKAGLKHGVLKVIVPKVRDVSCIQTS